MYQVGGPDGDEWRWDVPVACMTPRSRGEIHLTGTESEAIPAIDHAFLADVDAYDAMILADGVRIMRELSAIEPLRTFLGEELTPGRRTSWCAAGSSTTTTRSAAARWRRSPTRMPWSIRTAACTAWRTRTSRTARSARSIPRANTNLPAAVIGLRIAELLLEDDV